MKYLKHFLASLCCIAIVACDNQSEVKGGDDNEGNGATTEVTYNDIEVPCEAAVVYSAEESTVVEKSKAFACDLFSKFYTYELKNGLGNNNGNVIISPLGVDYCLSMVANACSPEVGKQFAGILGADNLSLLNATNGKLIKALTHRDEANSCVTTIANSVWLDRKYQFPDNFASLVLADYYPSLNIVDFSDDLARQCINKWAYDKTNGLIEEFYTKDEIPALTNVIFANAIYCQSQWAEPFMVENTKDAVFHGLKGDAKVPMMHKNIEAAYCSCEEYSKVILPLYSNMHISIILPGEGIAIENVLADGKAISLAQAQMQYYAVDLRLPRFKAETSSYLQVLGEMGFPTVSTLPGLGIDQQSQMGTKQNVSLEINEDGTKFGVVTATGMVISPGEPAALPKAELTIDRPFAFVVENPRTGTILLCGVINNL